MSATPAGGYAWLKTHISNSPSLLLCWWAPGWCHPQKLQGPLDLTTQYRFSSFVSLISFSCLNQFTLTAGSAPLGFTPGQALPLRPTFLGQLPLAVLSHVIISHSTHSESSLSCSPTTPLLGEGLISPLSPRKATHGFPKLFMKCPYLSSIFTAFQEHDLSFLSIFLKVIA